MKKNLPFLAIMALIIGSSSCSSKSSFENDVRKMANYRCERQKLEAKDQADEKVKKEIEDLKKEMEDYGNKMEKKYEKDKDNKAMEEKANKIIDEVMAKCK